MGVCMFPAPLRQLPAYPVCNASMKACLLARTLDFLGSRTRSMHTGPCLVMRRIFHASSRQVKAEGILREAGAGPKPRVNLATERPGEFQNGGASGDGWGAMKSPMLPPGLPFGS